MATPGFTGSAPPANAHPGYNPGDWYAPPLNGVALAGGVLVIGSVRLIPFFLSKSIRISDLGCRITTLAAAGNIRLAIYRADPANPKRAIGVPIVETGNISTAAAVAISAAVTAAATLPPGLYFMAVNSDNATVILQTLGNNSIAPSTIVGSATLANLAWNTNGVQITYTFASAFGAFPDLTGQALTEAQSSAWGIVYMKAS